MFSKRIRGRNPITVLRGIADAYTLDVGRRRAVPSGDETRPAGRLRATVFPVFAPPSARRERTLQDLGGKSAHVDVDGRKQ